MQAPSQRMSPTSEHRHAEAMQVRPGPQALPQAPQFASSNRVSVHTPAQLVSPSGQVQTLFSHDVPPVQTTPQPPQFKLSNVVSTHSAPQSVVASGHAQAPFWQVCPPLQTLPQAPQLLLSELVSTHPLPQHVVCPTMSLQQLAPHATSPASVLQH